MDFRKVSRIPGYRKSQGIPNLSGLFKFLAFWQEGSIYQLIMKKLHISLLCLILPWLAFSNVHASYPMKAEKVGPDVYAIISPARNLPDPENKGWNSNSAFFVTPQGVLLFDTGSSQGIGESLKKTIRSVTNKPVKWIINSHSHGDHWLGNAAFKDTSPEIYASEIVSEKILTEGDDWIDRFSRMTNGSTGNSEIALPTHQVNAKKEFLFGGRKVVMFLSNNSHSPGDIILYMPVEKILFTGDVVYSDRMPSTFAADVRHWIETLKYMEELNPNAVVPGHGIVTDKKGLNRLRSLLTDYWDEVKIQVKAGKTAEQSLESVEKRLKKYEPEFPGFDEKLKRDVQFVHAKALEDK